MFNVKFFLYFPQNCIFFLAGTLVKDREILCDNYIGRNLIAVNERRVWFSLIPKIHIMYNKSGKSMGYRMWLIKIELFLMNPNQTIVRAMGVKLN